MLKANIYVTLKDGVLDPQGEAVKKSLKVLDYGQVNQVRIGKFIEVWLEGKDQAAALKELEEMSDKLLANPVIEDYRVEIVEVY
ncbi:MAG: phosphoribosylformylglycinamidine synthase subunit PurS [Syntrophomonadaceae bacterium]|nr:phosphoribosylformylglycinamidine synthase subunit PurS [Syntrophomonadaceae bacterium]